MSDSTFEATRKHGLKMYILGLKHAVGIIEVFDDEAVLDYLKKQIEKEEQELEDERPYQV